MTLIILQIVLIAMVCVCVCVCVYDCECVCVCVCVCCISVTKIIRQAINGCVCVRGEGGEGGCAYTCM